MVEAGAVLAGREQSESAREKALSCSDFTIVSRGGKLPHASWEGGKQLTSSSSSPTTPSFSSPLSSGAGGLR